MALAPVAPEAVGVGALTISFLLLCFCILAFGMVRFSAVLVNAIHFVIAHTIGELPLVGSLVNDITGPVFRAVERGLAEVALGVQGSIGFYWHGLAYIAHALAREVRSHAHLLLAIAESTLPLGWGVIAWQEFGRLRRLLHLLGRGIDRVDSRIDTLLGSLADRIDARVLPRIRAIDNTLERHVFPDIAGLRARTRSILDELGRLGERLRHLERLLGSAAFAEAVAVALATLGVSWIRCRNWKRLGRSVCGMPSDILGALLGDGLVALAATDLCDLEYIIIAAAQEFEPVLYEFVDVEQALVGCHGNTAPPDRALPTLHLPPLQTTLTLAA